MNNDGYESADNLDVAVLIDTYGDELLRLCYLYLKDYYLAQDALQETFLRAYFGHAKFRHRSSIKTWLTSIAINICKNMLRKNRKTCQNISLLDESVSQSQEAFVYDDTLIREVTSLASKYKEVILLYYYQGLKINEISDILKIPPSTVSVRLKRARNQLKLKLEGWYYD